MQVSMSGSGSVEPLVKGNNDDHFKQTFLIKSIFCDSTLVVLKAEIIGVDNIFLIVENEHNFFEKAMHF